MSARDPHRLLILEESYQRLVDRLPGPDIVEPVFAEQAGVDSPDPTIAWYNHDLYAHYGRPLHDRFTQMMLGSTRLAWVQSSAAGTDNPVFAKIRAKGSRLSTSHAQAPAIAEYVMSTVLDQFQAGPARREAQTQRSWKRLPFRELRGSRWLIVGFGEIGSHVARLARAFGAHITAVRRHTAPTPLADAVVGLDALEPAMGFADVIVLCLPLNDATRKLIGMRAINAIGDDAILVNVGRGEIVDEAALLAGLDIGRPCHAILDVFASEPLPADSPFWPHRAVTVTAHGAAAGSGTGARNDALFLDNLERFLKGRTVLHEIHAGAGSS